VSKNHYSQLGLIVAAAGSSQRFGPGNKLLQPLQGMPLFCHCLKNLCATALPRAIVLVVAADSEALFSRLLQENLPELAAHTKLVHGGESRDDSVWRGLQALPPECEFVAVQDAARPLSGAALLQRCLEAAIIHGAAVPAHRITDSVKIADENCMVSHSLDRNRLWASETPQVIRREILLEAYKICRKTKKICTDEAQLLEEARFGVKLVENKQANPKITYAQDLTEQDNYKRH